MDRFIFIILIVLFVIIIPAWAIFISIGSREERTELEKVCKQYENKRYADLPVKCLEFYKP